MPSDPLTSTHMHKLTHAPAYNTGIHSVSAWENWNLAELQYQQRGSKVTPTCSTAVWDDAAFQTRSCFIPVQTGSEFILVQGQCSRVIWILVYIVKNISQFSKADLHAPLFFRSMGSCKISQKAEGGWRSLTFLFQLVNCFTMCHTASNSSTTLPMRRKSIDSGTPATHQHNATGLWKGWKPEWQIEP